MGGAGPQERRRSGARLGRYTVFRFANAGSGAGKQRRERGRMDTTDLPGTGDRPAGASGQLKRGIGPKMLLLFVVGDIVGAGIYARVGAVAGEVGGAIWVSFLVAMLLAALTGLSYAELVTKYPGAAGAALYVNRAIRMPFVTSNSPHSSAPIITSSHFGTVTLMPFFSPLSRQGG